VGFADNNQFDAKVLAGQRAREEERRD